MIGRVSRAVRKHGLRACAKLALERLAGRLYLDEAHIWYELDPRRAADGYAFDDGLELRRGEPRDADLLDQLETVPPAEVRDRLAAGHELWLVVEGDRPAFSCWIFHDRTPVLAAPDGELSLPEGTVCLEDSVTAAWARGRGVAPAAWTALARENPQRRMITKVAVDNQPSRRAVEKAGFEPAVVMRMRRIGWRSRTWVEPVKGSRSGFYAARLGASQDELGAVAA